MRHRTAPYFISALCLSVTMLISSCEVKWDQNGDLDGMWQMTEWRDNTGTILATKEQGYYFCFQLQLLKFQESGKGAHYLSYFTATHDSLIIGRTYEWPADSISPLSSLSKYGIPSDGRLHIDLLNSNHLILSSSEGILTFRKY